MCISLPFIIYIHVISAFVELLDTVFRIPQVFCFLSNQICQDPVEKYFGMQGLLMIILPYYSSLRIVTL